MLGDNRAANAERARQSFAVDQLNLFTGQAR